MNDQQDNKRSPVASAQRLVEIIRSLAEDSVLPDVRDIAFLLDHIDALGVDLHKAWAERDELREAIREAIRTGRWDGLIEADISPSPVEGGQ